MAFISTLCTGHQRSNSESVQNVPSVWHSHARRPWKPMWTCFLDHTTSEHPTPILNTCPHKWALVLGVSRGTRYNIIQCVSMSYTITNRDSTTSTSISLAYSVLEIQRSWCFWVTWWLLEFLKGWSFETFTLAFYASIKDICGLELCHLCLRY